MKVDLNDASIEEILEWWENRAGKADDLLDPVIETQNSLRAVSHILFHLLQEHTERLEQLEEAVDRLVQQVGYGEKGRMK